MPIRITCPSCSATLSVKDEFAGRAVKCPKCAGIIPPAPAPPTVSEPEAVATIPSPPPPPPAPVPDESEKPAKTGSKITGQPATRSKREDDRDEDRPRKRREDDEDDRPRRKPSDEEGDRDAPRNRRPRDEDDEDDRPRKRRDEDDEDDRDRPRKRRSRDERDERDEDDDRPARRRRDDDDFDDDRPARRRKQQGGSGVGLVLVLVVGSLLVGCAGAGYGIYWFAQQAKETVEKVADDLKKTDSGPPVEVKAEELAKAYKTDKAAADTKYKDKTVVVEGKLEAIDMVPGGDIYARLVGTGPGGLQVRCVVPAGEQKRVFECSRGQTLKLKGKCAGQAAIFVDVMSCKFESNGPDPSVNATTTVFLADYVRDEMAADAKYKEKQVTLSNAVVESKTDTAVFLVASGKAKNVLRVKVAYAGDFRKMFENLKPGDRVGKLKGECGGKFDNEVSVNGAWIVP